MALRHFTAFALLWASPLIASASGQRAAVPAVPVPLAPAAVLAPLPLLAPTQAVLTSPVALSLPLASPQAPTAVAGALAASVRALEVGDPAAALEAAVWSALGGLRAGKDLKAFARANGVRLSVRPFPGESAGLSEDNLAQYEPEDREVLLNWDLAGPDLAHFQARGLPSADAMTAVGMLLAPVAAHEFTHARLRLMVGSDFPGTREEEILTHQVQAEAYDEVLRVRPDLGRAEVFLTHHNHKAWSAWKEGFGPLARYVLRKYSFQPSFDDPALNAKKARELLASLRAGGRAPPRWLERAERAAELWEDPGAVARLTAYMQARIDAAARR